MNSCQLYIGTEFIQAVDKRCREVLGPPEAWSLGVSEQDPNVVRFRYPGSGGKMLTYVPPQVVLELGTHAEFVPHDRFTIRSFAAEEFPNVVVDGDVSVVALLAKRTFWEGNDPPRRIPPALREVTAGALFAALLRRCNDGARANQG